MPVGAHDPKRPLYLRVGTWHPKEYSVNSATGTIEPGVSAYDLDKGGQPVAPPEGEWAADDLRDRLRSNELKLLVHGDLVGQGHDGEPLLKKLFAVDHWKPETMKDFMERRNRDEGKAPRIVQAQR